MDTTLHSNELPITVKQIESRYAFRTEKTPRMWVSFVGEVEVAYMRRRRDVIAAAVSQRAYYLRTPGSYKHALAACAREHRERSQAQQGDVMASRLQHPRTGPSGLKSALRAKIERKQAQLAKLEERIQYLMSERAVVEGELGELLRKRAAQGDAP